MAGYKNTLYKLTFPNGMVYIGVSKNVTSRWYGDGSHYKGSRVGEAIQEFGWENIEKELLLKLPASLSSDDIVRKMERELIKAYDRKSYNVQCTPTYNEIVAERNKKKTPKRIFWTINNETKSMVEWCEHYNTAQSTVYGRMRAFGLTLEQALVFPKVPNDKSRRNPIGYWQSLGLLPEDYTVDKAV